MLRTHTCGELTEKAIGLEVTLYGWVDTIRDHGGVFFLDLRDRYGKTQLLVDPEKSDFHQNLKSEDCLRVRGKVQARPEGTENLKLPTGKVEVVVDSVLEHNASQPLPFEVGKSSETNEDLRMRFRFLDLRNPAVQKNFLVRNRVNQIVRETLGRHGFVEVETPILTKSTPEGARDYLVPSRLNQGEFYALPQSPQLFKQILMVSGLDRYFQVARCFRDEDLRADRQPEFTQLDLEMAFIEQEDLFAVVEDVLARIWKETIGVELELPFRRLSYEQAMSAYGSDKPDLRYAMPIEDASEAVRSCGFKVFSDALSKDGGRVLGLCVPGAASVSRKEIDDLTNFAKAEGAFGLAYFKVNGSALDSPVAKFLDAPVQAALIGSLKASPGDLLLFMADEKGKSERILGALRAHIARGKNLVPAGSFHFSWVTDFPLFKYNEEEKRWESEHHPFTSPYAQDWKQYHATKELGKIRSQAYDLVLNGTEIGSGSIRIHRKEMQKAIFETIGLDPKEAEARFGFLLKALDYGAPPHGGFALGLDRLVTILLGLDSIREVIAFPKNQKAVCPMTEAPSPVNDRQLKELGIKIR